MIRGDSIFNLNSFQLIWIYIVTRYFSHKVKFNSTGFLMLNDIGLQGSYPFLNKKIQGLFRTFKGTFLIVQGLYSVRKTALSLCLFYFFHNISNFILNVFLCLLLSLWSSS